MPTKKDVLEKSSSSRSMMSTLVEAGPPSKPRGTVKPSLCLLLLLCRLWLFFLCFVLGREFSCDEVEEDGDACMSSCCCCLPRVMLMTSCTAPGTAGMMPLSGKNQATPMRFSSMSSSSSSSSNALLRQKQQLNRRPSIMILLAAEIVAG